MREILKNVIETDKDIINRLEKENNILKENKIAQDELINISMMATDNIYTMIEPILASMPQAMSVVLKNKSNDPMVNLYVAMVQRGLKDLEEISIKYKNQVNAMLND